MSRLIKPINRIIIIRESESQKFIYQFNKNKVSKEFLNSCNKAAKLFSKQK